VSVAAADRRLARGAGPDDRARRRVARALVTSVERALRVANRIIVVACAVALGAAAVLLTASVVARYFLHAPTDWQDETSVLLLVGATFLSGAYVQSQRGHVAIGILSALLPPRLERARQALADLISLLFCAFFSWKSWTLLREAWVDGQTSNSTFAPPMWIPYSLMAVGMTLLTAQIGVQLLSGPAPRPPDDAREPR
jgi:TRAP-type C4-dicarboxylate transport system permease small subunit